MQYIGASRHQPTLAQGQLFPHLRRPSLLTHYCKTCMLLRRPCGDALKTPFSTCFISHARLCARRLPTTLLRKTVDSHTRSQGRRPSFSLSACVAEYFRVIFAPRGIFLRALIAQRPVSSPLHLFRRSQDFSLQAPAPRPLPSLPTSLFQARPA